MDELIEKLKSMQNSYENSNDLNPNTKSYKGGFNNGFILGIACGIEKSLDEIKKYKERQH